MRVSFWKVKEVYTRQDIALQICVVSARPKKGKILVGVSRIGEIESALPCKGLFIVGESLNHFYCLKVIVFVTRNH